MTSAQKGAAVVKALGQLSKDEIDSEIHRLMELRGDIMAADRRAKNLPNAGRYYRSIQSKHGGGVGFAYIYVKDVSSDGAMNTLRLFRDGDGSLRFDEYREYQVDSAWHRITAASFRAGLKYWAAPFTKLLALTIKD